MAICECGKKMSRCALECKACRAKREQGYQDLVAETNRLLKTRTVVNDTAFGPYVVDSVRYSELGVWISTHPEGTQASEWNQRSFMVCFGEVQDIHDRALSACV